jgi:hypothetical protein
MLTLGARPIFEHVEGAPFQPGEVIRVTGCCDSEGEAVGIPELIGKFGVVKYLEYECGSGQHFPDDPMIGVRFRDGQIRELWKDEVARC